MRIVFIGTGEIGVPTLRALRESAHQVTAVVTQPDKPVGRSQRIEPPIVKRIAADLQLPVMQPPRIKDSASISEIEVLKPDVIVVVAYGQILPRDLLAVPRLACLNLHASLLPKWRGAAPIQAAIAAGENETGITVMYMDEGLDTGDILLQRSIPISSADTGKTLHDRLAQVAPDALISALELLSHDSAPRVRQDNARATYAPKLNRESGRIDWKESAEIIERKIRAFNPWPGAFTEITAAGKLLKLKIFSSSIVDLSGKPGEILDAKRDLIVAAGKGALLLGEIQLESKRRMTSTELLRGLKVDRTVSGL